KGCVTTGPAGRMKGMTRPASRRAAPEQPMDSSMACGCGRDKGGAVIGVNVSFQYDGSFDRTRVIGVADRARATFEGMPGLRFKFFTLDESARRANNFYVWDSKEEALGFFSDELRAQAADLYGVAPTIEFVEIAQIVDNS